MPTALIFILLFYNGLKSVVSVFFEPIGSYYKKLGASYPIDINFQPFFTTKPTGEGTGLGLSMSYDIVTKGHGGDLKVNTKEGEGTSFTITLPNKKV